MGLPVSQICTYDDFKDKFDREYREKYYQTISKLSLDNDHHVVLCSSDHCAYNFDKIIHKWAEHEGHNSFSTVDAVSFQSDYLNFIEFKNSRLSDEKKYQIYLKIDESYRWFEKIFLDSHWFDTVNIKKRFIFVYNPEKIANGGANYQKINFNIEALASKTSPEEGQNKIIKSKLSRIYDVSFLLKYFDDIQMLTADEFMKNIDKYCN